MPEIKIIHGDCMEYMATLKDKAFDLAIVDPPYGINVGKALTGERERESNFKTVGIKGVCIPKIYRGFNDSQPPQKEYFTELMRVSNNQIIWGGNYFVEHLTNSSCWIVWDKCNDKSFFADCELAWTSFKKSIRKFSWMWNGMLQQNMKQKELRIHPTQKPVALYQWLLKNYAKQGDKILDTHLGSGSSAIAADIMGFDFVGIEIDEDYYNAALDRFNRHKQQLTLEI